jgi:16S rRNA (guanine966-N2)-methyltransferase
VRITGGSARGRRLAAPKAGVETIRPTCDRVRESLFNILGQRTVGSICLDLFAGTGAIGVEALSRGADFVLFVDQSVEAGRLIAANLQACRQMSKAAFVCLNLATAPSLSPLRPGLPPGALVDLVFMDPPYQKKLADRALAMVEESGLLAPEALILVEEHRNAVLPAKVGQLSLADRRRYGETGLWFYQRQTEQH